MFPILNRKKRESLPKYLKPGIRPLAITWQGTGPAITHFSDGNSKLSTCIQCIEPRCMSYSSEELLLPKIPEFPADLNNHVCPVDAISWPDDSKSPIIDTDICIGCGICVKRCPTRAIFLGSEGAQISTIEHEHLISVVDTKDLENFNRTIEVFPLQYQMVHLSGSI